MLYVTAVRTVHVEVAGVLVSLDPLPFSYIVINLPRVDELVSRFLHSNTVKSCEHINSSCRYMYTVIESPKSHTHIQLPTDILQQVHVHTHNIYTHYSHLRLISEATGSANLWSGVREEMGQKKPYSCRQLK